ncbi:MAG: sterol desaturase family protein [Flavobacteriales bacterium]|nr:sterol desaturase family protein [Flavobacteriales bacterium]
MNKYSEIFVSSFSEYWDYLLSEVFWDFTYKPWIENWFYGLILISVSIWVLELVSPWRKKQKAIRRDFWLDGFYMFFNVFLFSLIAFNAIGNIGVQLFNDFLAAFGIENIVALHIETLPTWSQLLVLLLVADFSGWWIHRLLHRVPFLWEFHKLHHSVKEMGFAAHLRFHWMETIVYRTLQYIPLAIIGFGLDDFFVVHMFMLLIGHLNHANIKLNYGPLKYIFNNPTMHLYHHAKKVPNRYGVNFGLTLSLWDYIFKTDYIPEESGDVELGFDGDDEFPENFTDQVIYPVRSKRRTKSP